MTTALTLVAVVARRPPSMVDGQFRHTVAVLLLCAHASGDLLAAGLAAPVACREEVAARGAPLADL